MWPFLQRALFRAGEETPLLVRAVVVAGLWASGEDGAAGELHGRLMGAVEAQRVGVGPSLCRVVMLMRVFFPLSKRIDGTSRIRIVW